MSRREDERRREDARDAALERSKRVRQFDNEVAKAFAEGESTRDTAKRLGCSRSKVLASRVWQQLVTGRAWRNTGQTFGRVARKGEVRCG